MAYGSGKVIVGVSLEDDIISIKCDRAKTMTEVKEQLQQKIGRSISVAFFSQDDNYLPDDQTIDEALANPKARMIQLQAFPKSRYWVQVFGLEYTRTEFEVAAILTPAAVRREIRKAVEILTDDFRLTWGDAVLDQEIPFNEQGLLEGAELMVDLRVCLKIHFVQTEGDETRNLECFCSDSVGDLRQRLQLNDDIVLVATTPYRRVLDDALHVCHIVSELLDLEIPIELFAERKVLLTFEPITLEHLRQQLPVALSCTPLDLYDVVSERFQLATEFRLAIHGEELDNSKPLLDQLLDIEDVIQIDIVRLFLVSDLWPDLQKEILDEVYLYSTESPVALCIRDALNDQRLYFDNIKLTIDGLSVVNVFGPISGQESPILLVDRDVERNIPTFSFDTVMRKLGWANDMLLDVVPMSGGFLPKEIMWNEGLLASKSIISHLHMTENTLMITDPEKVFVSSDKKLRLLRFSRESTHGDVRSRMQQVKGCLDVGLKTGDRAIPNEEMDKKMNMELYMLTSASRFQTKVTVTMKDNWYGCWFEPQQVSFSDVMIEVGKQAKVLPRHLFSHTLYCRGCGRKVNLEEEAYQTIPANCCRVKSLRLTDRRVKDVGIQTPLPRGRDVETYTLYPESRDVEIQTPLPRVRDVETCTLDLEWYKNVTMESTSGRAVISATPERKSVSTDPPRPCASLRIVALSPKGEWEHKTVRVESGSNCRAFLTVADRHLALVPVGDSPVIFSHESIYNQDGEERKAVLCFDESTGNNVDIDCEDRSVDKSYVFCVSLRYLLPTSPLPSARLPPNISIRPESEMLVVDSQGQLQATPASAFTDPSFGVVLFGIKSGTVMFWELTGSWKFVCSESDKAFEIEEIPGTPKQFTFALLRDKDPVPRASVPQGEFLRVLRRPNARLRVRDGCVQYSGRPLPGELDRWDYVQFFDHFNRDFADAARRQ